MAQNMLLGQGSGASASSRGSSVPNVPKSVARRQLLSLTCRAEAAEVTGAKQLAQRFLPAVGGALAAALVLQPTVALADLNRLEADAGGEFNIGTAQQMGSAEINNSDFSNQDLRRSNFTSAECRNCNFKNANLAGTYFIKAVLPKANFEGANVTDVLMDRAVLNDANLDNANLSRTVLTRSDLTGAKISGTDFSNALIDRTQQIKLCRYAEGVNPTTGVDTRKSLGCGSRRRFKELSPSSTEGPQATDSDKEAFTKSMPTYRK